MRVFLPLFLSTPIIVGAFTPSATRGPFALVRHGNKFSAPLYAEGEEVPAEAAADDHKEQHEIVKDYRAGMSEITRNSDDAEKLDKPCSVVMKFGGSSLANAERVDHVANLIKRQISIGYNVRAVVCSAMGKTTNSLLSAGDFALEGRVNIDALRTLHVAAINEFGLSDNVKNEVLGLLDECESLLNGVRLLQELSPKSLDQLVSYGERCSVRIMAARLNQLGVPAAAYDAWEVGIHTNSNFGDALLLDDTPDKIAAAFSNRVDPSVVAIVTGFIGHDPKGRITTLGRGGSDLTATSIGAACNLDEIQVWKDVDGILTTDPRLVENAIPVPAVTYDEASELAYFGAQVLHPIAMQPAMKKGVMVRVKNSYNPSHPGTVITKEKESVPNSLVTAITFKRNVQMVDIVSTRMLGAYGFLSKVFAAFEKHKLSVDVLASSEVSVSVTLDKKSRIEENDEILDDLSPIANILVKPNRSILTLIADVDKSSQVLASVFSSFSRMGIKVQMLSQGASKVNISFVVKDEDLDFAVKNLHKCFFEGNCTFDYFPESELIESTSTEKVA
mmetsp:Transcript_9485/g.14104  ORF Transcript_9485/g.14104 Transcript_9485/m.14104 type:complete len:560 (-) Transcript_9485:106-1785(-)|eukprot:CAMPEP_0196812182 /NCGR_PEP_ID=MMETSP1362-20130617/22197_1 /TAXON_ID=163516 /ORGANISM="Leptocylindrus danicus, Strain CCMP1856" /LENGTH=559 /DNA_ID=CAMNT_0042187673 /DNA_START=86 /DNA_END=1765 /DNA_ORIENTATION=-